jgi:hypothetical protein
MSFLLYVVGFIVLVAGAVWLATVAGVSETYVTVGAVVLLVAGISTGITQTRGL